MTDDHGKKATPEDGTCDDRSLPPVPPLPKGEGYGRSLRELHVDESAFGRKVGDDEARKLRARRAHTVWSGLGMMGLIGWSVAIPTLLGVALGIWLDERHPGAHSWTLALLVAGLCAGCVNAWHWVAREDNAMRRELEDKDD